MSGELGIAIIGTGRAGMIHARNYQRHVPHARVVAVSDPDPAAGARAADELGLDRAYTDHRELLKDPAVQAVVVVTPTKYHRGIVLDALAAGRHAFCEKPMAMNVAECTDMLDAARASGLKLQIGFMRRFDAGFRRAKQLIDDGAIGDVVQVKSMSHGPSIPHPWMYDITASNGALAEVASHDVDTIRWLCGSEVARVHALAGNYRSPQARAEWPDFYDTVLMTAAMRNGTIGCVDGAQGVRYGYDARVEILGTNGSIDIGDLAADRVRVHTADGRSSRDIVPSWRNLFADAYVAEDAAFTRCILDNSEPEVTGEDGLRAVQIVNAGNESIRTGAVVELAG